MNNRISVQISQTSLDEAQVLIQKLRDLLGELVSLTVEERKDLPKMGDKTLAFVQKACQYAKQNPQLMPGYFNTAEFEIDVKAVEQLQTIQRPLKQLLDLIDDSILLSGSEAYISALETYGAFKLAAKNGVEGAKGPYDDMSERFPQKRYKK